MKTIAGQELANLSLLYQSMPSVPILLDNTE